MSTEKSTENKFDNIKIAGLVLQLIYWGVRWWLSRREDAPKAIKDITQRMKDAKKIDDRSKRAAAYNAIVDDVRLRYKNRA